MLGVDGRDPDGKPSASNLATLSKIPLLILLDTLLNCDPDLSPSEIHPWHALDGLDSGNVKKVGVESALPAPNRSNSDDGSMLPLALPKLPGVFSISKLRYESNERLFISARGDGPEKESANRWLCGVTCGDSRKASLASWNEWPDALLKDELLVLGREPGESWRMVCCGVAGAEESTGSIPIAAVKSGCC